MMADFLPAEVDVLIVGAGPVGLCAANLLGTFGIDAYVIERRSAASTLPRAIMVDDETLRTLQACGLDRQFQAMIRRGRGARYYDENGKPFAEVGAGPMNYGFPKRSHFFQPDLEGVLGSPRPRRCDAPAATLNCVSMPARALRCPASVSLMCARAPPNSSGVCSRSCRESE